MTRLGEYLILRPISQVELAAKTGITKNRINQLCNNPNARLLATEAYLISLALKVKPGELLAYVCQDVTIPTQAPEKKSRQASSRRSIKKAKSRKNSRS